MGLFKFFKKKKSTLDSDLIAEIAQGLYGVGSSGTDKDQLPGGYGNFGYDLTNPIPAKGIAGGYSYLDNLITEGGETVQYDRIGSFGSEVSDQPIDGYKVTAPGIKGEITIYISPYNKKTSTLAPEGFKLKSH